MKHLAEGPSPKRDADRPHQSQTDARSRSRQVAVDAAPYLTVAWLVVSLAAGFVGLYLLAGTNVTNEVLLIAVALGGAAGAALQATSAVATYIGNQSYVAEWTLYFFIKPIIGAATAVVAYVLLRLAIVDGDAPPATLNYYGIAVLAFLSGFTAGSIVRGLTTAFEHLLDRRVGSGSGVRPPSSHLDERREIDRFEGFLMHQLKDIPGSKNLLLLVWLQRARFDAGTGADRVAPGLDHTGRSSKGQDIHASPAIDVGKGVPARHATWRVNVYPADCEVEPWFDEITLGRDAARSTEISFVLSCPSGGEPSGIFLELTQRGRTVAVVTLGGPTDDQD